MFLKRPNKKIDGILERALRVLRKPLESLDREKVGIIVSGGVDSSTLYALALKELDDLQVFSLIGQASQDVEYLKILERVFKRQIKYVNIDDYTDRELKERVIFYRIKLEEHGLRNTLDQVAIAVGFDLLFEKVKNEGVKYLLTAQGPDVLVAGYARYKGLKGKELKAKIKADLRALEVDKKRDNLVADKYGVKLVNPYLTDKFIRLCLKLPEGLIVYGGYNKYLVRLLAEKLGLPEKIVTRPKKAFQYSTRLQKRLEKIVKKSITPGV